jgi:uncharacterized protein
MVQSRSERRAEYRPDRRMDPYAAQFWEFTKVHEFRLQQCNGCEKYRWPPAPVCDGCLSEQFTWTQASGKGKVLSWVVFCRQYFSEYPSGHRVVSLELDDGPLFITIPVDMGDDELRDGMQMELAWEKGVDKFGEYNLPAFKPTATTWTTATTSERHSRQE